MDRKITYDRGKISGVIPLTPSKSISNRLLILRKLSGIDFTIENLATAGDTATLVRILNNLQPEIDAGDAGTVFRFLTAMLSVTPGQWKLTGSARMRERPVGPLVDALLQIGSEISYTDRPGFPPLNISGRKPEGGVAEVDASLSSQYISALCMIAPFLEKGLHIQLRGKVSSSSYIDMTLGLMRELGLKSEWIDDQIVIQNQQLTPKAITVENDWSAASYWYETVALTGLELFLEGLKKDSLQGDSVMVALMESFGVRSEFNAEGVKMTRVSDRVSTFRFNFESHPDLVPAVAATCVALKVRAELAGVQNLRIKESDRLQVLQRELGLFGAEVVIKNDSLLIRDFHPVPELVTCDSHNDHRIAMAVAPLAVFTKQLHIQNSEAVAKSYPEFWDHLKLAGYEITG